MNVERDGSRVVLCLLTLVLVVVSAALWAQPVNYSGQPGTVPGEIQINLRDGAEMVWVPAGDFLMGVGPEDITAMLAANPDWSSSWFDDCKWQHRINMSGFWIYKNEVTVAQYRSFCSATGRSMPPPPKWGWKDDYPIVNVTWQDAVDYALWAGVTLPTEAQWEKAARGTDGRRYPWGDVWDATKCANYVDAELVSTKPVGSFLSGASPYGALDMAGNVWEWCSDWFLAEYYNGIQPSTNPTGPAQGTARVLRGGSWLNGDIAFFMVAKRSYSEPHYRNETIGFRCAVVP